ncbi:astakine [Tetranychus urticae]|uniref:astakine n=1 Tax=Tetranychus urticae TaxID=32264 RepID=UPI00077C07F8|nr:astakine [Tetranychus urticae]
MLCYSTKFIIIFALMVTVSGRTWNFFALNSPKPCQSSDDCRRGECCAIGFARFSVPMCKPMGRINDWCYPDNEPENMTLHYPYGSEAYTNVHRNFCPCKQPLTCEHNICKFERFNYY